MINLHRTKLFLGVPCLVFGLSLMAIVAAMLCLAWLWDSYADVSIFTIRESSAVITVSRNDPDGFPATAEAVSLEIGEKAEKLDYHALIFVAHNLLFVYASILIIWLTIVCQKRNRDVPTPPCMQVARHLLPATLTIFVSAYFAFSLSSFGEYYPTRWSYFPAWSEAARNVAINVETLLCAPVQVLDELFITVWYVSIALGVMANALLVVATVFSLSQNGQNNFRTQKDR